MSQFHFAPLPAAKTEVEFRDFLTRLDANFEALNRERTHYTWAKMFKEAYDPAQQAEMDRAAEGLYSEAHHDTIKAWKDRGSDPLLLRWAEVLDKQFTMARLEQQPDVRQILNHLSDRYMQWRPKIDGEEISYTKHTWIYRHEPDREIRRKAYMAFWELGEELDSVTREIFQVRNAAARELGYPTYGDMKLDLVDGVSRDWVIQQFEEMERVTGPTYHAYLQSQQERYNLPDVQPWDIQYLFDQDPWPDLKYFPSDKLEGNLFGAMASLGLDSKALGISMVWYDSQAGGQCVTYNPDDIRILFTKGEGMLYYNTAFHEYGHAAHSAYYAVPHTLQRESGMFTEGIAMTWEQFLHYPSWLRKTGVPTDEIDRYRATRKLPRMYRHRRIAAMVFAELAMWDDPTHDIDRTFGETTARWLVTEYQPRPFASVARWTWPMQLQSYFIAELIASQTHNTLRQRFAPIFGKPEAMQHLIEHYLAPGNRIPWQQKVKNCTGEDLSYHYLGIDMTQELADM